MKYKNFSKGTLTAEFTDSATNLTITTSETFPTTGQFKAVIWGAAHRVPQDDTTREILTLEWNSGESRYDVIGRNEEDTSAKTWASGSYIGHVITAAQYTEYEEKFSDGGETGGADRTIGNTDNYALGFLTNNINRLNIENSGVLSVVNTTDYEDLVTSDDDIPNRKYVDDNAGGGLSWVEKTTTYTTSADEGVLADTSGGAWTLTLPASPSAGDTVGVSDAEGSFATNNLTVGRNSSNIMGSAEDLVIDIDDASFLLIYNGANDGWKIDTYLPVDTLDKALGADINTGTDDEKYVTSKGLDDSDYSRDDETVTLTNKTIDADNNTISNLAIGSEVSGASTDLTDTTDLTYNTDSDVSGNSWVLDQDDMSGDSNTKVPTQQSVKKYVDDNSGETDHGALGGLGDDDHPQYKKATPRVWSAASDATPDIDSDDYDAVTITALAADITDVNMSGTPTNFQKLLFRIKDNGSSRSITWGADFQNGSVELPTETTASKTLMVGVIYDSVDSKWTCEASGSRE